MRKGPILIVEDVPNVRELLEVTLRFKGYPVLIVGKSDPDVALVSQAFCQVDDLFGAEFFHPKAGRGSHGDLMVLTKRTTQVTACRSQR